MFELQIPMPAAASIAIAVVIGVGWLSWQARGIVGRIRRVEENSEKHEEECKARAKQMAEKFDKIDSHLATIYEVQTEMRENIAYLKAREEERQ